MKRLFCSLLCLVLLSACSPAVAQVSPSTSTAVPPTATIAPPTATATQAPPTETPLPTATPTLQPSPTPEPITARNAIGLTLVRRVGDGRIEQVVWAPDGKSVALLTSVHLLLIDAQNGEVTWKVETGSAQQQVVFTADGVQIVTLGAGGAVKVWDALDGALLSSPVPQQTNILYASLACNGSTVAMTNYKRETSVWDVKNGAQIYNNKAGGMPAEVAGVLAGHDGSWFVTSGYDSYGPNQQIRTWDAKTGQPLVGLMGISNDFIADLATSSDGKYIAGVSRLYLTSVPEMSLIVWDAKTGAQLHRFSQTMDITSFSFTSNDTLIFSSEDGQLHTASISTGKILTSIKMTNRTQPFTLAVSPDSKMLALAGSDGALRLRDIPKRSELHVLDLSLSSKAYPYLLIGNNYLLRNPRPFAIGLPEDGSFVAIPAADRKSISLIDPVSLLTIRTIGKSTRPLLALGVSPDGKWAAGSDSRTVYLWDVAGGQQKQVIETGHRFLITKLMFSPDSRLIYALSNSELYGYDIETGERVKTLSGYNSFDFSPDGSLVISDNIDFGLYFWDAVSGRQLALPSADWILDVDFAPDGKTVAIAGWEVHKDIKEHTNLVTFMDPTTYATAEVQLTGGLASLSHVRYSPDGSLLATLDDYGNLLLWDITAGKLLARFDSVAPAPGFVEFFSNGRTLVVGSADGTLRFYELGG